MKSVKRLATALVRYLTAWAWRHEIGATDGIAYIKEMHATEGAMELHVKQHPEAAQWVACCFASMVDSSPNYTELQFNLLTPQPGYEWITVTVKKGSGKTPHQLREIAEKEAAKWKAAFEGLRPYVGSSPSMPATCDTPP